MKNYQEKYKKYKSKYLLLAGSDSIHGSTFVVDKSVRTYEPNFLVPSSTNPINNPKFVPHQSAQISFQGIGIPIPITFLLSFYISSQWYCQGYNHIVGWRYWYILASQSTPSAISQR